MNKRLVVDPITRIEGHLRIEAELAEGNAIKSAYSSGTMVRGIEIILRGRDPREAWAFAQRICGVCTLVHGMAAVRAVENALGYDHPRQCAADPQPDARRRNTSMTTSCTSTTCMRSTGSTWCRAKGRSEGDLRAGAEHFGLRQVLPGYFADSRSG